MYRSRGIRDADVSHPTEGTLTGTVNGSPQTFGRLFQSPVPEPTSLACLAPDSPRLPGASTKCPRVESHTFRRLRSLSPQQREPRNTLHRNLLLHATPRRDGTTERWIYRRPMRRACQCATPSARAGHRSTPSLGKDDMSVDARPKKFLIQLRGRGSSRSTSCSRREKSMPVRLPCAVRSGRPLRTAPPGQAHRIDFFARASSCCGSRPRPELDENFLGRASTTQIIFARRWS